MPIKIKLELDDLNPDALKHKADAIVEAMTSPANPNFPTPSPALADITAAATALKTQLDARSANEAAGLVITQNILARSETLRGLLRAEGGYVEGIANANDNPVPVATAIALSAAMGVVSPRTPVGPMPKVTGLSGTQGDEPGEVDLHWHSILRGLAGYVAQHTSDPAAATGWLTLLLQKPKQSKASIGGFPSGTKVWFRVAAQGTDGVGPWSDPVQVTIP